MLLRALPLSARPRLNGDASSFGRRSPAADGGRRGAALRIRMGGGPRTYPGGVKKWQWKRRRRKDDEKLLAQRRVRERKLFETRRRLELQESSLGVRPASFDAPVDGVDGAALGKKSYKSVPENWTRSRSDVAEQIFKVQEMVKEKKARLARDTGNECASGFGPLSLSPLSLRGLSTVLDIRNMTPSQEATIPIMLDGRDLLARTATAGEDVIASLLVAIELIGRKARDAPLTGIAKFQRNLTVAGRFPITALVVCPTQERAALVASDAKSLLTFHSGLRVQMVKGGNDINDEARRLRCQPCDIVVATPGRLLNQLQRSPEFRGQLSELKLFVLLEVNTLLDMGYQTSIERIRRLIFTSRQTVLWSSSLSNEVLTFSQTFLKRAHKIFEDFGSGKTEVASPKVRQSFLVVPIESHLAVTFSLVKMHAEKEPKYKVVVFCQTARTTLFMAEVFKALGYHALAVHRRKREKYRDRVAAEFRTLQGGVILFTCGTSVWGTANPDVTLVLQVGPPIEREQYVRRVTMSGQESMEREYVLLMMPHQEAFLKNLTTTLEELAVPEGGSDVELEIWRAVHTVDSHIRSKAYVAWLRYHITAAATSLDKEEALKLASIYSRVLGFQSPPELNSRTRKAWGLDKSSL